MRLARVLGAIGRGLISAGVIVLLFVAYQLWGTGLQHAAAQGNLVDQLEETTGIEQIDADLEALSAAADESQDDIEAGQILASDAENTVPVSEDDSGTTDDGEVIDAGDGDAPAATQQAELNINNFDEATRQEFYAKLYPEPGEAFARVVIPAISVDQISVEGVSVEDLRKGPGHYRTTPNPGQAGNAAIAGHRTTYGAPFHRVDELKPGDPIFVTTAQGTFKYTVLPFDDNGNEILADENTPAFDNGLGYFIVSPSQTEVLNPDPAGRNLLTLTACHPKYSARQRIIVQAVLDGNPAVTIPRDEAVEIGSISLDAGAEDERAGDERAADSDAVEGDGADVEIPAEEQVIISAEVAADDDPTVDADGNPIDDEDVAGTAADGMGAGDGESAPVADDTGAGATSDGLSSDEVLIDASNDAELTVGEGPLSTDDFGEGLNGDPTKVRPAIMWGIAGLFIWVAAWFMGKELERKWTLYAMGFIPFLFVLWSTFVNVDQALPSY